MEYLQDLVTASFQGGINAVVHTRGLSWISRFRSGFLCEPHGHVYHRVHTAIQRKSIRKNFVLTSGESNDSNDFARERTWNIEPNKEKQKFIQYHTPLQSLQVNVVSVEVLRPQIRAIKHDVGTNDSAREKRGERGRFCGMVSTKTVVRR